MKIQVIYPDECKVSPETVIGWWSDVASDEGIEFDPKGEEALWEAIEDLSDMGLVTFSNVADLAPYSHRWEPRAE